MISGNGLPAASGRDEGVRYIEDLIAKLEVVNRQLSFPLREMSTPVPADAGGAENPQA